MRHGIVIYDTDGLIVNVSVSAREMLGISSDEEWQGQRLSHYIGEDALEEAASAEASVAFKLILDRAEPVEMRLRVESMEASDDMSVAHIEDFTKQESGELKFLSTISHELRAPLNGIIGFVGMLSKTELSSEQRAILDKLQMSNFVIKGLINDLLEFYRIQSSQVEIAHESAHVGEFARQLGGLFSERARVKGLDLRIAVDSSAEIYASLPKLRVMQVLTNLLSNAIKFTRQGVVLLSVSVNFRTLAFNVQDTGPGISDENVSLIFEPFGQVNPIAGAATEGSGLGLAISSGLARLMGGSLEYFKRPEGGSSFTLQIPFVRSSEMEAKKFQPDVVVEEKSEQAKAKRSSKQILIVEDNKLNADILAHFLSDFGCKYDVVYNGKQAVEAYLSSDYDLILMDVMLPEMNGYEATRIIREKAQAAGRPSTPILGVTAKAFRDDDELCFEAGMSEVVHKPVDFKRLGMLLEKFLEGTAEAAGPDAEGLDAPPSARHGTLDVSVARDYARRMSSGRKSDIEVIAHFCDEVESCLDDLKAALSERSLEKVERRAHRLKGSLGLVGAYDMMDLAKGLELAARSGDEAFRPQHWSRILEEAYISLQKALADLF